MGSYLFRLPDVGEGVTEAEIAAWHVKVGDRVAEDQPLLDVMTDKATVDMTSPVSGRVIAVHGEVGERMAVGSTLVELEVADKDEAGPASHDSRGASMPTTATASRAVATKAAAVDLSAAPSKLTAMPNSSEQPESAVLIQQAIQIDGPLIFPPRAAPATRRRAHELGIPLEFVRGTGPTGRILIEDLQAYAAARITGEKLSPAVAPQDESVHERKIIGLRRKIAEKMEQSSRRIPHFTYVEELDLTDLERLRQGLNEARTEAKPETRPKLTLLPFFMRALVRLRPEFPQINAQYDDEAGVLREYKTVHIGIATQTPQGLTVAVVRDAQDRDLWDCARELQRVTAAAKAGLATREQLTGSTITLTSLGALGGIAATPIINAPEVAIIGPNKLVERPVVRNGSIVVRTMMNLSASFDHRIVDGHDAARFVQRLKTLIEQPAHLFIERP